MTIRKILGIAALASFAATGCIDLEVINPNQPDRERALVTSEDIESLIGGSFTNWWWVQQSTASSGAILATISYMHSATAANFGMVQFSGWPKVPAHFRPADVFSWQNVGYAWSRIYRCIAAAQEGLRAIEGGAVTLAPADEARAQAVGNFTLGLCHGHAAILYDQAYIYDQSVDPEDVGLSPSPEVLAAALGYLDKAIAAASGQTFDIPVIWIPGNVNAARLVQLAHSFKARYRAAVARTPAERAAVDWNAVLADIDKGITADFGIDMTSGSGFFHNQQNNMVRLGAWGQLSYQVLGMADTSGQYQRWLAIPPDDRHPNLSADRTSDPFLIITPDTRFAQGNTLAEQEANPGSLYHIWTGSGGYSVGWLRPDRGTFRWSYYRSPVNEFLRSTGTRAGRDYPEITLREMNLLKAEGLYRNGNLQGAADLVNLTRTAAGLNATDAAGTNTSCVPRLPNGQCGDLWEMLKWEVRLETLATGYGNAPWYYFGRGWGDLAEGTFLQVPVPGDELELLLLPMYTFGGIGGEWSDPVGTYGY